MILRVIFREGIAGIKWIYVWYCKSQITLLISNTSIWIQYSQCDQLQWCTPHSYIKLERSPSCKQELQECSNKHWTSSEQPRKHCSVTKLERELKQQLSDGIKEGGVSQCSHLKTQAFSGDHQSFVVKHRTSLHFLQFILHSLCGRWFLWFHQLLWTGMVWTAWSYPYRKNDSRHQESEGLLWLEKSMHTQNRLTSGSTTSTSACICAQ